MRIFCFSSKLKGRDILKIVPFRPHPSFLGEIRSVSLFNLLSLSSAGFYNLFHHGRHLPHHLRLAPSDVLVSGPSTARPRRPFAKRCRATEMDVTMIGLQNAGKSSLLRVLAVGSFCLSVFLSCVCRVWYIRIPCIVLTAACRVGSSLSSKLQMTSSSSLSFSNQPSQLHPDNRFQYQTSAKGPCHSEMVCVFPPFSFSFPFLSPPILPT